ncbi:hypothetical protein M2401_002915 [Pseudomonas sp. JUb42]|jgi:hypothetical protein|uniref:YgdI/YgdR family lipoprotein n=1 Tax=Pseudomonas sp. JUb42 TaxID=2940611 RepID=UPI0021691F31|nr:YgdI/YgdR family lipoprotein [Pseudomonas sp. JUb42]MCS3469177.1 hypothetical protein [Pseudomonas sp. JUb42]
MKTLLCVLTAALLAGCAAPSGMARSGGPKQTLTSDKPEAAVAQCLQIAWQDEKLFGNSFDVFMNPRGEGGHTVFTTENEFFADVYAQGRGTLVEYYTRRSGEVSERRVAAIATCL